LEEDVMVSLQQSQYKDKIAARKMELGRILIVNFGDTIPNYGIQVSTHFFFGGFWSRVKRAKSNPKYRFKT
jgi:hypothetical protein